jgi:HD superfamily phosphohydrolase
VGHLPFSHGAEELLPKNWNHERLTAEMIRFSEISIILKSARPPIDPEDVVDLAWDVRKRAKVEPKAQPPWKTLLNEILTGNTFGADRIDYLLRDSLHAGVAYGRFDPDRLIDGLRAIIDPVENEITLGLDHGAIHAAEALLVARYFMYTQVYFHDVRRIYDIHLKDFLVEWLPEGVFSPNWRRMLRTTDIEVLAALTRAASVREGRLHLLATRLTNREHYRMVYEQMSTHKRRRPTILEELEKFARRSFGSDNVRVDRQRPKAESNNFLVLTDDGRTESSLRLSRVIATLPAAEVGYLFVAPALKEKAKKRIDAKLAELLKRQKNSRGS